MPHPIWRPALAWSRVTHCPAGVGGLRMSCQTLCWWQGQSEGEVAVQVGEEGGCRPAGQGPVHLQGRPWAEQTVCRCRVARLPSAQAWPGSGRR